VIELWPSQRETSAASCADATTGQRPCGSRPRASWRSLERLARLRLLSVIAAQGEFCSCHLQQPLGKRKATMSHHIPVLAEALIEGEKRGKWTR